MDFGTCRVDLDFHNRGLSHRIGAEVGQRGIEQLSNLNRPNHAL